MVCTCGESERNRGKHHLAGHRLRCGGKHTTWRKQLSCCPKGLHSLWHSILLLDSVNVLDIHDRGQPCEDMDEKWKYVNKKS